MGQQYEELSESQCKILEKYVTNTTSNIFALRNLPEVVKGALFSRYSRSNLGLRSLLLKEFIQGEEAEFFSLTGEADTEDRDLFTTKDQVEALQKAQNFYDRILDGYGDDSIGELGGAHLAIENISMLGAKALEDCRIGGSPLEKSTRYLYFDQKVHGEYAFYREPVLMASAYRELYLDTCNLLFDTYSRLIPSLTAAIEQKFPKGYQMSKTAYAAALRTKVLDCLRGLLPASTLTNLGLFGNGRFFENMIQKLCCSSLSEMQDIGKESFKELSLVIPSFVRRAESSNKYFQTFMRFSEQTREELKNLSEKYSSEKREKRTFPEIALIDWDRESLNKVAGALLFEGSSFSLQELQKFCSLLPEEKLSQIFEAASLFRENRRHKSPRALEQTHFTFDLLADFGVYRDLQRHRMLTQERQLLTCNFGYFLPPEIVGTEMEEEYTKAMEVAKTSYDIIAKEFPEEAQYVVPMAYHLRWYIHVNLRSLQWLCELRSSPAGHSTYRFIAQELAKNVMDKFPPFRCFFKFVDFDKHAEYLGRLEQEQRSEIGKKR